MRKTLLAGLRIDLGDVRLRSAGAADKGFAETLYLATMLPLLAALGQGDETKVRRRFARGFKVGCSQIAGFNGNDIGWVQISDLAEELHLDQLHLISDVRGCGIGTHLLRDLLERGRRSGKAVGLDVIRGNRAFQLYRRLGFNVVGEDDEKHRMLWRPETAAVHSPRERSR